MSKATLRITEDTAATRIGNGGLVSVSQRDALGGPAVSTVYLTPEQLREIAAWAEAEEKKEA